MKEVAGLLYITPLTVAAHQYTAMEVLQFKASADLVQ
jgi:DNA-binding CsgD family transcriptional regulator